MMYMLSEDTLLPYYRLEEKKLCYMIEHGAWFLIRTMDFVKAAHIVFVTDVPNVIASVL
jgi:hypothetical protein